ncbi:hypothetical protein V1264_012504 [Littorina saxatilis]
MKRFSAPPALYPQSVSPPVPTHPSGPAPTICPAPPVTSTSVSGMGHTHHHHHHQHHHHHPQQQQQQQQHPHDPSGKRVKTDPSLEWLLAHEAESDVTVSVNSGQLVFAAHRVVLAVKSEVLAESLAHLLQDSGQGEGHVTGDRPVLHVEEEGECCEVFSRFLYFLYSGAVWLHQDYVLPLYRLARKYKVTSLSAHCHNYVLQVLAKSCTSTSSHSSRSNQHHHHHNNHNNNNNNNNNNRDSCNVNHNHSPPGSALSSPNGNSPPYTGSGFSLDTVCELYEAGEYEGDIQRTAYRLLCCQFPQLVRSPRWQRCQVSTVCSLLASDAVGVEENVVLVAATDFMKRTQLADKKQIENILSLIRYPRLPRRVLYHLHKNGSFTNFPRVQELMLGAIKFHAFRDLPESRDDFTGPQFRPRVANNPPSPSRRASMHLATVTDLDTFPPTQSPVLPNTAFSLEPALPVTVTRSRQSQV